MTAAGTVVNSGSMARSVSEVVIPLTIRDLTTEDLPSCAWSGSATHLASIAKALERVPDDYALWHMRGHALLAVDQPAEALEVATRLLAIDPERLDGWLDIDSSARQGRFPD